MFLLVYDLTIKEENKIKQNLNSNRPRKQKHKKKQKNATFHFSAIHLLHDPQGMLSWSVSCVKIKISYTYGQLMPVQHTHARSQWFYWLTVYDCAGLAEKLFKQLEATNERFEVKVMLINLIARLVGIHELFLFNFYPFVSRFLQPHQRGRKFLQPY